ncbi:hypothetical protein K501DRAFT_275094 [Backusella circina FSU 941]|nr:hypothetical protein K501DRAFT_275094 [Backusella circina FSU 941]
MQKLFTTQGWSFQQNDVLPKILSHQNFGSSIYHLITDDESKVQEKHVPDMVRYFKDFKKTYTSIIYGTSLIKGLPDLLSEGCKELATSELQLDGFTKGDNTVNVTNYEEHIKHMLSNLTLLFQLYGSNGSEARFVVFKAAKGPKKIWSIFSSTVAKSTTREGGSVQNRTGPEKKRTARIFSEDNDRIPLVAFSAKMFCKDQVEWQAS